MEQKAKNQVMLVSISSKKKRNFINNYLFLSQMNIEEDAPIIQIRKAISSGCSTWEEVANSTGFRVSTAKTYGNAGGILHRPDSGFYFSDNSGLARVQNAKNEGYSSVVDIAHHLGLSVNTVKLYLSTGGIKLHEIVTEEPSGIAEPEIEVSLSGQYYASLTDRINSEMESRVKKLEELQSAYQNELGCPSADITAKIQEVKASYELRLSPLKQLHFNYQCLMHLSDEELKLHNAHALDKKVVKREVLHTPRINLDSEPSGTEGRTLNESDYWWAVFKSSSFYTSPQSFKEIYDQILSQHLHPISVDQLHGAKRPAANYKSKDMSELSEKHQNAVLNLMLRVEEQKKQSQDKLKRIQELGESYKKIMGEEDHHIALRVNEHAEIIKNYDRRIASLEGRAERFAKLMQLTDDQLSIQNSNERVSFDFKSLGLRLRTLTEDQYYSLYYRKVKPVSSPAYLNQLGEEYVSSITSEFPGDILMEEGEVIQDRRSQYQKDLAKEIAERVIPFLRKLGKKMLQGLGVRMKRNDGRTFCLKITRPTSLTLEEMISEGAVEVIKCLHQYDPSKAGMLTYLTWNSGRTMQCAAYEGMGLLRAPQNIVEKAIACTSKAEKMGRSQSIHAVGREIEVQPPEEMHLGRKRIPAPYPIAVNIYAAINQRYVDIDHHPIIGDNSPSNDSWGDRYLTNENAEEIDETIRRIHLRRGVREIVKKLRSREARIIKEKYFYGKKEVELAREMECTPANINRIKHEALRRLRYPNFAKSLRKL